MFTAPDIERKSRGWIVNKRKSSHEPDVMPNDLAVAPKILNWPGAVPMANDDTSIRVPWYIRLGHRTGITMASADSQKGWKWDPQNIGPIVSILSFFILILGGVVGLTWYLAIEHASRLQLEKDIKIAQEAANVAQQSAIKAGQLGAYKAGAADAQRGHVDSNTNTGGH